ncbi:MAG: hypothetical protein NTX71_03095 [Candidatus Aureabacteria bacterium]|nr:hypothetical protein [Candidatus Auribacterota bacterium]
MIVRCGLRAGENKELVSLNAIACQRKFGSSGHGRGKIKEAR